MQALCDSMKIPNPWIMGTKEWEEVKLKAYETYSTK
jgi:hypothetical protein